MVDDGIRDRKIMCLYKLCHITPLSSGKIVSRYLFWCKYEHFRIYYHLISWFKSKYGIGFLYTAYRYCTYFFALGIHCCERISLSWSLFISYIHRFVITLDDWVTWLYSDRHTYDPINGQIITSKSYID